MCPGFAQGDQVTGPIEQLGPVGRPVGGQAVVPVQQAPVDQVDLVDPRDRAARPRSCSCCVHPPGRRHRSWWRRTRRPGAGSARPARSAAGRSAASGARAVGSHRHRCPSSSGAVRERVERISRLWCLSRVRSEETPPCGPIPPGQVCPSAKRYATDLTDAEFALVEPTCRRVARAAAPNRSAAVLDAFLPPAHRLPVAAAAQVLPRAAPCSYFAAGGRHAPVLPARVAQPSQQHRPSHSSPDPSESLKKVQSRSV